MAKVSMNLGLFMAIAFVSKARGLMNGLEARYYPHGYYTNSSNIYAPITPCLQTNSSAVPYIPPTPPVNVTSAFSTALLSPSASPPPPEEIEASELLPSSFTTPESFVPAVSATPTPEPTPPPAEAQEATALLESISPPTLSVTKAAEGPGGDVLVDIPPAPPAPPASSAEEAPSQGPKEVLALPAEAPTESSPGIAPEETPAPPSVPTPATSAPAETPGETLTTLPMSTTAKGLPSSSPTSPELFTGGVAGNNDIGRVGGGVFAAVLIGIARVLIE